MTMLQGKQKTLEDVLASLKSTPPPDVDGDIAEYNLLCAAGLPGSHPVDINAALVRIDEMAHRINSEIHRNYHRFLANPPAIENSQAKYCVAMMVTVLQLDFGVRYNPERIRNPDFRNASDLFIHGMLGGDGGTCASMPVLYTAVGRRLGWPMKLVHAHSHLFCRWDDLDGRHPFGKERFNLEATGPGANFFPDDYYRTWPERVPDEMVERLGYLKSLTAAEELADFLMMRGHCLEDNGWIAKACESYRSSSQLVPTGILYLAFWEHAERVRDNLIEKQTLLDYFGPDVPLPFGYFPRHVLRKMASDMSLAKCEHFNQMNQLQRERLEANWPSPAQAGWPHARPTPLQVIGMPMGASHMARSLPNWHANAGVDATGFPIPNGLAGIISNVPSLPGWMDTNFGFPSSISVNTDHLPANLLRTIDPQRLAMRRHEAVEIAKSLPKGIPIRQPIRLQLTPSTQSPAIQ